MTDKKIASENGSSKSIDIIAENKSRVKLLTVEDAIKTGRGREFDSVLMPDEIKTAVTLIKELVPDMSERSILNIFLFFISRFYSTKRIRINESLSVINNVKYFGLVLAHSRMGKTETVNKILFTLKDFKQNYDNEEKEREQKIYNKGLEEALQKYPLPIEDGKDDKKLDREKKAKKYQLEHYSKIDFLLASATKEGLHLTGLDIQEANNGSIGIRITEFGDYLMAKNDSDDYKFVCALKDAYDREIAGKKIKGENNAKLKRQEKNLSDIDVNFLGYTAPDVFEKGCTAKSFDTLCKTGLAGRTFVTYEQPHELVTDEKYFKENYVTPREEKLAEIGSILFTKFKKLKYIDSKEQQLQKIFLNIFPDIRNNYHAVYNIEL